jgi:hypothetical protein
LTDVYGNMINLHGQNISFTLVFCPKRYWFEDCYYVPSSNE